jgi:hypothetical protein
MGKLKKTAKRHMCVYEYILYIYTYIHTYIKRTVYCVLCIHISICINKYIYIDIQTNTHTRTCIHEMYPPNQVVPIPSL